MSFRPRLALVAAVVVTALVAGVHGRDVNDANLQFQLGTLLFEETRYREALEAFRKAVGADSKSLAVQARIGVVKSALRLGEFIEAQKEATTLKAQAPTSADVIAVHADALWSAGLFDEAHQEFKDALALVPDLSRGHHGLARALASQNKLDDALNEAQVALKLAPRDEEIHHTVGTIFERMRRYEQAAAAYGNYVNLLPNKDRSDKAAWSRSQIRFLRSFGEREPIAIEEAAAEALHTVDFRVIDDKVIVKARVNGGRAAGLRARHRFGADDDFAPDGIERGRAPDHLHAECRRRRSRPARPAVGPSRQPGDRHAEVEQRPGADQGAGAARHPEARDRELLAARAWGCR